MTTDRNANGIDDLDELQRLAVTAFRQRGFVSLAPSLEAEAEAVVPTDDPLLRDLRHLPWTSIDNASSKDLDQVEWCESLPDGATRLYVGIADVIPYLPPASEVASVAEANTTTVYTAAGVFPMLPRVLSEGLTSLLPGVDRRAMVTVLDINAEGLVTKREHFPAVVRNQAKFVYETVSAWFASGFQGEGVPSAEMCAQLKLQDDLAHRLHQRRVRNGSLGFSSTETELVRDDDGRVIDIVERSPTMAGRIVENFMLAINGAVAQTFADAGVSCLRRVVRPPPRWDRLRELAATYDVTLPSTPDPQALSGFLMAVSATQPARLPDLEIAMRKLIGQGEYRRWAPGDAPAPHFALAVDAYAHSTAPNRRLPDVVVQRSLHALLRGERAPYSDEALDAIAARCTERAGSARKVERQVDKSAAALFLANRVGEPFQAVVSGNNGRGVWVKLARPAVEGRLVGSESLDVGERVEIRLTRVDIDEGHLDFERIPRSTRAS